MLYTHRFHGLGKALIIGGLAGCGTALVFLIAMLWHVMQPSSPATQPLSVPSTIPVVAPGALGAEGSACGGPVRYPCNPGLICSVPPAEWGSHYGTCGRDTRNVLPLGDIGAPCDAERGCQPGLACSPKKKVCIPPPGAATSTAKSAQ